MSEDDSKTEEPTPKKLEKTKEEGQFARSQDLSVAALTIGVAIVIYFVGGEMGRSIISVLQEAFVFDSRVITDSSLVPPLFGTLLLRALFLRHPSSIH